MVTSFSPSFFPFTSSFLLFSSPQFVLSHFKPNKFSNLGSPYTLILLTFFILDRREFLFQSHSHTIAKMYAFLLLDGHKHLASSVLMFLEPSHSFLCSFSSYSRLSSLSLFHRYSSLHGFDQHKVAK